MVSITLGKNSPEDVKQIRELKEMGVSDEIIQKAYENTERTREMPEIKLKPCPFCGGIADVVRKEKWEKVIFFATCLYCGAEMPRNSRTVAEAAEAWNRRADNE